MEINICICLLKPLESITCLYSFIWYSVLATKREYENRYCKCIKKHNFLPWCARWQFLTKGSYCLLNGGLKSEYCPGAIRLNNDYITADSSVCNKALRKFFLHSKLYSQTLNLKKKNEKILERNFERY